jgi:hypothetical protein
MSEKAIERPEAFGLLAEQLLRQGQAGVALQTICAALIQEVCMLQPDPAGAFDRISARLLGTAMGVSAIVDRPGNCGSSGSVTATIEAVTLIAEGQLARDLDMPRSWRRKRGLQA